MTNLSLTPLCSMTQSMIIYTKASAIDYVLKKGLSYTDNFGRHIPLPAELYAWSRHGGSHALPSPGDAAIPTPTPDEGRGACSSALPEAEQPEIELRTASGAKVSDFNIQDIDPKDISYVLIEYCCSETSALSNQTFEKFNAAKGKQTLRIRCSDRQDMTKAESVESLKRSLRSIRTFPSFFGDHYRVRLALPGNSSTDIFVKIGHNVQDTLNNNSDYFIKVSCALPTTSTTKARDSKRRTSVTNGLIRMVYGNDPKSRR